MDPVMGKVGTSLSANRYSYVLNNPIKLADPDGATATEAIFGFAQGILGSLSLGVIPNTDPSPNDAPDQQSGQVFGAMVVGAVGLNMAGEGSAAAGLGLLVEAPSGGTATVLVEGGAAAAAAGLTATLGAGVYLAKAAGSSGGGNSNRYKSPKTKVSGKKGTKDVPSWSKGKRPLKNENGKDFAERLLNKKYGKGNWKKGAGSEFNKIRKWGDRSFE